MATTENIHERIQNLITKICQERISFNTSSTSNINNNSNRRNLIFVTHNNVNRRNIIFERYNKVIELDFDYIQTENILHQLYQLQFGDSEPTVSDLSKLSDDLAAIEQKYNTTRRGGNRKRTTLKRRRR